MLRSLGFVTALIMMGPASGLGGQAPREGVGGPQPSLNPADSADLHRDARSAQARFERIRVRQSPVRFGSGGPCDERVGRMCIHLPFGDSETDWEPPPENQRIVEARETLVRDLQEIGERIPGDDWVMGQLVAYLGEAGEWGRALDVASDCQLAQEAAWWCRALQGKVLHHLGRFVEAEGAFEDALEEMPEAERREWSDLETLLEPGLRGLFRDAERDSLSILEARVWAMADPLLLVPGNDRRSEHFARHTLARIRSDARTPYQMSWGSDLAEILVRYGSEVAYEREHTRFYVPGPDPIVGRFEPRSRGFLPEEEWFREPAAVQPGEWRTDQRRARSRHAPSYAPRIGGIDVEQFLFRRGGESLVIFQWEIAEGRPEWTATDVARWEAGADEPNLDLPQPVGAASPDDVGADVTSRDFDVGLFLLREVDLVPADAWTRVWRTSGSGGAGGVALARVPAGRYLVSLEVLDPAGRRAWRSRHGARQDSIPRGIVALSDLVLLESDAAFAEDGATCPGTIEAHVHRLRSGRELADRVAAVAWEVYGLEGEEGPLRFRLSAEREDRGLLRRAGELLRIVEREPPLEIRWEEGISENDRPAGSPLLRCVNVDLSALPTGTARLTLRLDLPGRTEIRAERLVELPEG